MATVIDTLLVALGFETSDFKKGQKEVQEGLKKTSEESSKRAKEIEARAKLTAEAFKKVRQEVISMIGALVSAAGVKSFVTGVVTADAATKRLADNLGIGVNRLAAWQKMSASFGGSAEDIAGAFQNVNRIIQGIATGQADPNAIAALGKLMGGADLSTFISRATTAEERMKLLQRAIARAPNRQNALTWAQQAGFTEQTFTVMTEMGSKVDEIIDKYERMNRVTADNAEQAKRLKTQWNESTQALENLGRVMLYTVAPAAERILGALTPLLRFIGNGDEKASLGTRLYDFFNAPKESLGSKAEDDEYDRRLGSARFAPSGGRRSGKASTAPTAAPPARGLSTPPKDGTGERMVSDATQRERDAFAAQLIRNELDAAKDPALRAGLQRELSDIARITSGGNPFAARYSRSVMAGASSASRSAAKGGTSTTEVHVGTVNVTTQATDANGIARDIVGALQANYSLATQSTQGLR